MTPGGETTRHGETSRVRVLLAVVGGARTMGEVADETGLAVSEVFRHCSWLRDKELVTWESGRRGTLRAKVRSVLV